jgi:hypothetical protein
MINGLPELHTGQLRDISRTGILFHSQVSFEVGTNFLSAAREGSHHVRTGSRQL